MHIFTVYSKSHQAFLDDFFLPSLALVEPSLPVTAVELPQLAPTGVIGEDGFKEILVRKWWALWDFANNLPTGTIILCADCDIEFYRPFAADLGRYMKRFDLVFQPNLSHPTKLNTGFTCLRWTPRVRAFIRTVISCLPTFPQEEVAANNIIRNFGFPVRSHILPAADYWSISTMKGWRAHETVPPLSLDLVPRTPYMHHGVGAVGTPAKIQHMLNVREFLREHGQGLTMLPKPGEVKA